MDRNVLLAVAAAKEAWADAGHRGRTTPTRVGHPRRLGDRRDRGIVAQLRASCASAARIASPRSSSRPCSSTRRAGRSRSRSVSRGPNYAPVSACATGSHAVGEGAEMIKRGQADVVLAGGTEAAHRSR